MTISSPQSNQQQCYRGNTAIHLLQYVCYLNKGFSVFLSGRLISRELVNQSGFAGDHRRTSNTTMSRYLLISSSSAWKQELLCRRCHIRGLCISLLKSRNPTTSLTDSTIFRCPVAHLQLISLLSIASLPYRDLRGHL